MSAKGAPSERATVLPVVVVSVFVLFAVLSFAIDQGIAYAAKARQENALDAARSACMDASFALAAKNAVEPARAAAERVFAAVRAQGVEARVSVWFYEAPAAQLPRSERLWAIGMQVQEEVPTVFAQSFGIEALPVASYRVMVAVPYAAERAWRPKSSGSGRFDYPAGATAAGGSYTPLATLGEFPAEMVREIESALPGAPRP